MNRDKLDRLLDAHFTAMCVVTIAILLPLVLAINLFLLYVGVSILQSLGVL